ncbi:MAG: nickel pincer cofactor biosynthesis protein LarC [Candidatus Omnitrophica bacterium]|nr:nickel pincer cofactor biosynthesis protein LarC [Candidatus Omnitrophota bacterium]
MKIAYFDCFSGISGDMALGAFIDLGLKLSDLKRELLKLNIPKFQIKAEKVKRGHISGTKVKISSKKNFRIADLKNAIDIIDKSRIDTPSKKFSKEIFTNLAKAEAAVHNQPLNKVHFHQLGELDTIVDIVGCVLALKLLGIEKVYSSSLTIGTGTVNSCGEVFPLPAPAVLELIKNRTVNINPQITHEVITPTGAAIISTLAQEITASVNMKVLKTGYGAGTHIRPDSPNLLRIIIAVDVNGPARDSITVIETNIDDTLPLNFEILYERLFKAGALDVYTHSVMMKKMRQGVLLNVQAEDGDVQKITDIIFQETSTIGVRLQRVARLKLMRKILNLKTNYGIIVRVKIACLGDKIVNIAPEYEDCKKIAANMALPFKNVYDKVKAQAVCKFAQ